MERYVMGFNLKTIPFTSGDTHRVDVWEYLLPQALQARKGFRTLKKKPVARIYTRKKHEEKG